MQVRERYAEASASLVAPRPLRAIVGSRVSRVIKEGKTSHHTQREAGERYAAAMDWEIVGAFEDLDVSATISPWERPDLGPWLNDRSNDWDAIIWAKVDRAFRSVKDCSDVAHWAEQNKKILVFADDGIVCNFRDGDDKSQGAMIAKLFLMMSSIFAEMELKRHKARNQDTRNYMNQHNRFPGGRVPYGFKVVPHPEGGKTLAIDESAAEVIRTIGKMFLAGTSWYDIAAVLTSRGVPTPTQHILAVSGERSRRKTPVSSVWNGVSINQLFQSPTLMGYKCLGRHGNRTLARDETGMPIRMSEGIFTEEEWTSIQAEIKRRGFRTERRSGAAPLLGVVYCGTCQHRLYLKKTTRGQYVYNYYRCPERSNKTSCPDHVWREEYVQGLVDEAVLLDLDGIQVTRKVFVPGESHTAELAVVLEAMDNYMDQFDRGTFSYPGGAEMFQERMTRLGVRRGELEALPQRADAWVDEPTGETYAQAYGRMNAEQRRLLLIMADIRFLFTPNKVRITVPPDLMKRATEFQIALPATV